MFCLHAGLCWAALHTNEAAGPAFFLPALWGAQGAVRTRSGFLLAHCAHKPGPAAVGDDNHQL